MINTVQAIAGETKEEEAFSHTDKDIIKIDIYQARMKSLGEEPPAGDSSSEE